MANIKDSLTPEQQKILENWLNNPPTDKKSKKVDKIPNLIAPPKSLVKDPKPIESILFMIRDEIEKTKSVEVAQQIIDDFIETYQLKQERSMGEYRALMQIRNNTNYPKLLSNMYSSILRFSGLGSPDTYRNRNRYR